MRRQERFKHGAGELAANASMWLLDAHAALPIQRTGHDVSALLQLGQVRAADEGTLGLHLGCI
jgi:hypothetical protein